MSAVSRIRSTRRLAGLGAALALLAFAPDPVPAARAPRPAIEAGRSGTARGAAGTSLAMRASNLPATVATFSIAAADTATGTWGVAVASKFFAVGAVVPWAAAGAGAIATQAFANTTYGPRALARLAEGASAADVLQELIASDTLASRRQVGLVDRAGQAAQYTGTECQPWAGGIVGPGYAVQGNILAGPEVVAAMARAFEAAGGHLGERLLAALNAGEAAGGDSRGRQSAALLLVRAGAGYGGHNDRYCDLRVDDHPDPFAELTRLFHLWLPDQLITEGYRLVEEGKFAEAIARGERAAQLRPDEGGPLYHLACYLARAGEAERAMHYLRWAVELDPTLRAQASTDPDFATLRAREEYRSLVGP